MLCAVLCVLCVLRIVQTIKTKIIHDQNKSVPRYRGLLHGTSTILREEGPGGVYKGLLPTMLRQSANSAVRFTVYDTIGNLLRGADSKADLTFAQSLFAGVCAGTINVYVTMPLGTSHVRARFCAAEEAAMTTANVLLSVVRALCADVVKTRLQGLEAAKYKGVLDCGSKVVRSEGVLALWKGTVPRLSRVGLSGGLTFSAMETCMRMLNRAFPDADSPAIAAKVP
jgi:solute carrier family 25 (mitochondrial citrate transporter), member 1